MNGLLRTRTLLLLDLVSPSYGQQLMRRARDRGFRLRPASVYPALRALQSEGFVRSWEERAERGRPRRLYELTPDGVRLAERRRESLIALLGLEAEARRRPLRKEMTRRIRRCVRLSAIAAGLRTSRQRA